MVGEPYFEKFNIPLAVGWHLQKQYPDQKVVVNNVSQRGENFRMVLEQLQDLDYRPHVLLVYSGHNEFYHGLEELERLRKYRSWLSVLDPILKHSRLFRSGRSWFARWQASRVQEMEAGIVMPHMAPPEIWRKRLWQFRQRWKRFGEFCQQEELAVICFVPVASEADYPPNRSYLSRTANTSTEEENRWVTELLQQLLAARDLKNWPEMQRLCEQGLQQAPEFAEFHYWLGHAQLQQGKKEPACESFQQAWGYDGWPNRIPPEFQQVIVEVLRELEIPQVHSPELLRAHTECGILDRTMVHDNVHLTLKAYDLLSRAAVEKIHAQRFLQEEFGEPSGELISYDELVQQGGLTREDIVQGYRHTAEVFDWLHRLRWERSAFEDRIRFYEDLAERLEKGEIDPGEEGTDYLPEN